MKTVEIVNTNKGCFITRRYCGMNKGREFFFSVVPHPMAKKKDEKEFLRKNEEAKQKYINDWIGE